MYICGRESVCESQEMCKEEKGLGNIFRRFNVVYATFRGK